MNESIEVTVEKTKFLEVGRIFSRVYKPRGAAQVNFRLGGGKLVIEFQGGGCEFPYAGKSACQATMKAKEFAGIIAAHRSDRHIDGVMVLTFRPGLGEIATKLAGGKATFSAI